MKQFKKLFAGVLALCMLFTFMPAAMAATYTLQGESTLFAPPVGRKAEVRYELLEDSTAVSGAELSILGQPAGVSLNADKTAVVLDGDTIQSGSFTVTATKDGASKSKTVSIYADRYYSDFETTLNEKVQVEKINLATGVSSSASIMQSLTTGTVKEDENGNKYCYSIGWNGLYLQISWGAFAAAKDITIEFDVRAGNGSNIIKDNSHGAFSLSVSDNGKLTCTDNGTAAEQNLSISSSKWTKIMLNANYYTKTYTVTTGSETTGGETFGPFAMSNNGSNGKIHDLMIQAPVDNLAFYTGTAVLPKRGTISGTETIYAPHKEQKSKIDYSLSLNDKTINNVEWSLVDAPAGVTINSSGSLIIDGATVRPGTFTVKAVSDEALAEKSVTIYDLCYFIDFQDIDFGEASTVDAKAQRFLAKKLSDGTVVNVNNNNDSRSTDVIAIEASNGNKYYKLGNTFPAYAMLKPQWAGESNWKNNKQITVEVDVKSPNNTTILSDNTDGNAFTIKATSNKLIVNGTDTGFIFDNNDWTKLQMAFDFEKNTINVWADGNKVATDVKMTPAKTYIEQAKFICNVDNIAFYSGAPVNPEGVYIDANAYTGGAAIASGSHNINVALGVKTDANSKRSLVVAQYSDGVLNKLDFVSKEFNGSSLMRAALNSISGGEVRIFLWDGALVPIKITSIPTTVN